MCLSSAPRTFEGEKTWQNSEWVSIRKAPLGWLPKRFQQPPGSLRKPVDGAGRWNEDFWHRQPTVSNIHTVSSPHSAQPLASNKSSSSKHCWVTSSTGLYNLTETPHQGHTPPPSASPGSDQISTLQWFPSFARISATWPVKTQTVGLQPKGFWLCRWDPRIWICNKLSSDILLLV